jgi:LuxR family maltose regulon positive regulatory protein
MLYEQNELGAAHRFLSDALTLARFWPNPNHLPFTYALLSSVQLAEGDLHGARISIGEADQIRRSAALSRLVQRMVEADLVRVLLAFQASGVLPEAGDPLGDQAEAIMATWRKELAVSMESTSALMDEPSETAALTLARVLLAARRAEEALSLLQHLTQSARTAGHTNAVIGALVLTAMTKQARGARQAVPALADLEEALYLAELGGYVRVFLDEGKPMIQLLKALRRSGLNSQLKDYIDRLLRASTQNHH